MVKYHIAAGEPQALFHTVLRRSLGIFDDSRGPRGHGKNEMTASDVSIYVDHSVVSSKKISWTLSKMHPILTSSEDFDQDSHFRVNRLDVV